MPFCQSDIANGHNVRSRFFIRIKGASQDLVVDSVLKQAIHQDLDVLVNLGRSVLRSLLRIPKIHVDMIGQLPQDVDR